MDYGIDESIAGARTARAHIKELGLRGGWTNAVMVDRALARELTVSADGRRRTVLDDGAKSWWFSGGKTNFNHSLAVRCTRQKEVTNSLLRSAGLKAPENAVFGAADGERAWGWAEAILPVVVKPSNGIHGEHVHVEISDREEFLDAFTQVSDVYGRVLVEEFVAGVEHRVLVVGKKVFAVIRREPAHVVGDGVAEVRSLIKEKSDSRRATGNPLHGELKVDELVARELRRQNLSLDSVPGEGRRVNLRATSNTHFGGDAVDATEDLLPEEVEYVERAMRVFSGLRFAGFDVLLPRDGQGDGPCIVEINANPAISLHHFPIRGEVRDAAGRLLDLMFP